MKDKEEGNEGQKIPTSGIRHQASGIRVSGRKQEQETEWMRIQETEKSGDCFSEDVVGKKEKETQTKKTTTQQNNMWTFSLHPLFFSWED